MKIILVDAINTLIIPGEGIYMPLYNLLEKYPHRKIILTGANDKEILDYSLDKAPYELFTLKHNPEKSDPNYYKILMDTLDLKVKNLIYIEHNIDAVHSAESLKIDVFHYDKDLKDIKKLKFYLDNNLS